MIGEFIEVDFRMLAATLFFVGLTTLIFYYTKLYLNKI
jgi:hypothetical protein